MRQAGQLYTRARGLGIFQYSRLFYNSYPYPLIFPIFPRWFCRDLITITHSSGESDNHVRFALRLRPKSIRHLDIRRFSSGGIRVTDFIKFQGVACRITQCLVKDKGDKFDGPYRTGPAHQSIQKVVGYASIQVIFNLLWGPVGVAVVHPTFYIITKYAFVHRVPKGCAKVLPTARKRSMDGKLTTSDLQVQSQKLCLGDNKFLSLHCFPPHFTAGDPEPSQNIHFHPMKFDFETEGDDPPRLPSLPVSK